MSGEVFTAKAALCAFLASLCALVSRGEPLRPVPPATVPIVQYAVGYNAWPMIQAVGTRLVCAYSRGSAHTVDEGARGVFARVSENGGTAWSAEKCVCNSPEWGEVPVGKGLDSSGAMLLWVRSCPDGGGWGSGRRHDLWRTTDGLSWEKISTLALDPNPIQITDIFTVGDPPALMCFWFAGSYAPDAADGAWGVLTSADDGRTWTQRTVENGLARAEWPTKTCGVWLGGGRILAVARSEGAPCLFQITSVDGGATWTRARTNISDVNASTPSLVYDKSSGRVFNYYYHRGARQLKRRVADASQVFANPAGWPNPEVVAEGQEERPLDAGDVNATAIGDGHFTAAYTGSPSNTAVAVVCVPGTKSGGARKRAFSPDAVPAERIAAFRKTAEARIVRYENLLAAARRRIEETFDGNDCLQRERALARYEVAGTMPAYVRRNLASKHPDDVYYAYTAMDDLDEFLRYFDEELAAWQSFPREQSATDPGNDPLVLDFVRDFGAKGDGTTDNSPAWDRAMAAVKARNGEPTILHIGEGRFRFADTDGKKRSACLPVNVQSNLLIRGVSPEKTWLVGDIYARRTVSVSACHNVALRDFSVTVAHPTYCQGKILALDYGKAQVTIRHDARTLRPDDANLMANGGWKCCTAYADDGTIFRTQNLSWNHAPSVDLGDGVWRLQMDPTSPIVHLRVGMNLVLPNRIHASAVSLNDYSSFCSAERVHVRRSYAAAFGGAGRYSSYKSCVVRPEDGFIYATNADSFIGCGGVYIADFEVDAPGDDCINDYVPSRKCSMMKDYAASPGLMHGVAPEGRIRHFLSAEDGQYVSLNRVVSNACAWASVYEDRFPNRDGRTTYACDPRAFGVGSVIRRCHFRNTRSGANAQLSNMIIEDCTFERAVHGCGLMVGNHSSIEGIPPYHITFRRNRVVDSWGGMRTLRVGNRNGGAATLHGLVFEDNEVVNPVIALWVSDASDVLFRNNRFTGSTEKNAFGENGCQFIVSNSEDVRSEGNLLNGCPVEFGCGGIRTE